MVQVGATVGCATLTTSFLPSTVATSVANDTNVTGSISGQVLTLGWSGTLAKGRTLATTFYDDQSNTVTTGTQNFSAITLGRWRNSAGLTTSVNGDFGFDLTNLNWHFWNGADRLMVPLASGFVSGDCGQPTSTAGKWEIVDAGFACGSGGGGGLTASGNSANQTAYWTSGTNLSGVGPGLTGQNLVANNAAPPSYNSPGLGGRSVSGITDTILCDSGTALQDRVSIIRYTSASAVAVTLPDAGSAGCGSNFVFSIMVTGAGTVTVTRQTASTITWVNGYSQALAGTSIALPQNSWVTFNSPDNANWLVRGVGITTLPNTALANTTITVNTQTCTLGGSCTVTPANIFTSNFSAHQFWGNDTGAATPPSASLIGGSDTGPNEYAADSGAVNAYVIAPTPAITALSINARAAFTTANANTGASTINVNGLGVKNLTKKGSTALVSGDILAASMYDIRYDGTQWEVLNPSATSGSGTPCTTTALSLQYNNAGAFGCVTQFTYSGSTVTGSAGTLDLSGMTLVKQRVSSGLTTTVNGDIGQNSTDGAWHAWTNGADRLMINSTNKGVAGQVPISNADGTETFADPNISYNTVNIWNVQDVTTTRTSAAVRNPIYTLTGTLQLTWAGITGSPATCTLQIQGVDSQGNALNNGGTVSVSPANGTTSQTFTAANTQQTAAQIKAIFACVTYPTAGTLTLDFTGIPNVNVTNTVTVQGTVSTNPAANASTNITQLAGNAISTDPNGRQLVRSYPDTTTTSYHASASFAGSSTTDNSVFPGNATNTAILTKITVTCTQTTASVVTLTLIKRSAADTSGTSATMTKVPDDSNYAAAVSAPLTYTGTGPSVGAAVGNLDVAQFGCNASATAGPNDIYVFKPAKPIILRGTAQQVAVNMGNAAITGGTLTVTYDWMESTTP